MPANAEIPLRRSRAGCNPVTSFLRRLKSPFRHSRELGNPLFVILAQLEIPVTSFPRRRESKVVVASGCPPSRAGRRIGPGMTKTRGLPSWTWRGIGPRLYVIPAKAGIQGGDGL